MKNKYLLSIVEVSKQFNLPRDRLYAESRRENSEIPFIKIGSSKKIYIPKLIELLENKAANKESLF
jgi:hypothetical protein